ncbi:hypothetical protein CANCADRAFT_2376 [Tortispora caseinolytica NRRL Y-17796]|uniref:Biogenesis of lysosome-related organelles complex 1 subunit CNL1 n=1 Tax=Tortispora caseinolytica NRRL Y-17796 TaxID=767744 RepID=A0A1E4TG13_9ASCO|nr:hypothetical protein CANCADRAFT_2376 [Tortispora caseinolytica NRRL Y-17796]
MTDEASQELRAETPPVVLNNEQNELHETPQSSIREQSTRSGESSSSGSVVIHEPRTINIIEPSSMQLLSRQFNRVLDSVSLKIQSICDSTHTEAVEVDNNVSILVEESHAIMNKASKVLKDFDALELELDKITILLEMIEQFKSRLNTIDRALGE